MKILIIAMTLMLVSCRYSRSNYEKDQQFIDSLADICRDYIETKELYIIDCEICGELISSDSLLLTE
jgi:hypothetical protein